MKTKKKNWVARGSIILFLVTLGSVVLVSSTLIQYKVLGNGQLNSRTANFNFDITASAGADANPTITPLLPDFINLFDYRDQIIGVPPLPGTKGSFIISLSNKSKTDVSLELSLDEVNTDNLPIVYAYDGRFYSNIQTPTIYLCLQEDRVFPVTLAGDLNEMEKSINELNASDFSGNDRRNKEIASIKWFWSISEDSIYSVDSPDHTYSEYRYRRLDDTTYCDSTLPVVLFKATAKITPTE